MTEFFVSSWLPPFLSSVGWTLMIKIHTHWHTHIHRDRQTDRDDLGKLFTSFWLCTLLVSSFRQSSLTWSQTTNLPKGIQRQRKQSVPRFGMHTSAQRRCRRHFRLRALKRAHVWARGRHVGHATKWQWGGKATSIQSSRCLPGEVSHTQICLPRSWSIKMAWIDASDKAETVAEPVNVFVLLLFKKKIVKFSSSFFITYLMCFGSGFLLVFCLGFLVVFLRGKGWCWWLLIIHFIYLLRALSLFSAPFVRCLAHCSRGGLELAVWVRVRFLSPFSSSLGLHGHRPVTSPLVINETCWWLPPLPIIVHNHSGDCGVTLGLVPLFPHLLGSRPRQYLFDLNKILFKTK